MTKQQKQEYEANVFAACFLIPEESIRNDLKNLDMSNDKEYKALCRKYEVPLGVMAFRISLLKRKINVKKHAKQII